MNKQKRFSLPLLIIMTLLLILSACGGAQDATIVEEAAQEVVEDSAEEEMVEEEMAEEVEEMAEEAVDDFSADRSEGEDGSPVEPSSGAKAEPTRAAAEVALAEVSEEVRVVEEVVVEVVVESESSTAMTSSTAAEVPTQSQLTAGEIDDNEFWDDYLLYLRDVQSNEPFSFIWMEVVERHTLSVRDGSGRPIVGEPIELRVGSDLIATRHTQSDGSILIFPGMLDLPNDNLEIEAVLANTGEAISVTFGGNQREWELRAPTYQSAGETQLDILFLIDGTGSMADEIEQLRDNMIAISQQIDALPSRPMVRYGLSLYRDQGEPGAIESASFVTDVNEFTARLNQLEARGGGDYAEDLVLGLETALDNDWQVENTVSLIFLVADAPPHLDYGYDNTYVDHTVAAAEKGIKLFSIASSGLDPQGEFVFRQMSQATGGKFIFLTYGEDGAGSTGTDTDVSVDPDNYTVEALDELIVNIIEEELANLSQIQTN